MKTTKEFWSKKQFTDSSSMEQWMQHTKHRTGNNNPSTSGGKIPKKIPLTKKLFKHESKKCSSEVAMVSNEEGFFDFLNRNRMYWF